MTPCNRRTLDILMLIHGLIFGICNFSSRKAGNSPLQDLFDVLDADLGGQLHFDEPFVGRWSVLPSFFWGL